MVSHLSLSDSKSPHVFRILLNILADLNKAIFWMIATCPLISKYSSPFINPFVTVPSAPITISISCFIGFFFFFFLVSLFSFLTRSTKLSLFSLSFSFTLWSAGTTKSTHRQVLYFCWLRLGLVVWPRLGDPFVSQNPRKVCASHYYYYYYWISFLFFSSFKYHNWFVEVIILFFSLFFCWLLFYIFIVPLSTFKSAVTVIFSCCFYSVSQNRWATR